MITEADIELTYQFRKSPTFFIERMWKLKPQPLKPEYKEIAEKSPLREYQAEWFESFIRGKHITWQQWTILLAVEKALRGEASKRISVKSGHGIGKDATLSWLILWYLFCFKDSQIPCTAPTSQQMYDILWKEISVWLNKMPREIKALYDWQINHIRMVESPETWFARAQTAKKETPEALAGVHGRYVFLISDEASGVHDLVYTTAEGALTGMDFFFMMISNPTRLIGFFYDSHHSDAHNWQNLTFNAEESPIVERQFIERIIDRYGRDSDEYRVQVQGEFPKKGLVDTKGYVPLLVEEDIKFAPDTPFIGSKRIGIDPAGTGQNKSEWVVRDSFKAKVVAEELTSTPKTGAQKTLTLLGFFKILGKDCWLDNFGEGSNWGQELALTPGIVESRKKINAVSFSDDPDDKRYLNKRAEMYWRTREWLRRGGEIVRDEELKRQLLSIRYREELSGRIKIMSKDEMRKEGISSPDKADSLALTFYKEEERIKRKPYKQEPYVPQFDWEKGE